MLTHKISFRSPHLSITEFPEIELPDFTLITGLNGTGKSHFLEAISQGMLGTSEAPGNTPGNPTNYVRLYNFSTMIPNGGGQVGSDTIRDTKQNLWNMLYSITRGNPAVFNLIQEIKELNLPSDFLSDPFALDKDRKLELEKIYGAEKATAIFDRYTEAISRFEMQYVLFRIDQKSQERLRYFADKKGCLLSTLSESDIMDADGLLWMQSELFQQTFASMFVEYRDLYLKNMLKKNQFDNEATKEQPLSKEEFFSKFRSPPWDVVNDIFAISGIDFKINAPDLWDYKPYGPQLTKISTNRVVAFEALSSGEKILMSFAFCVYLGRDDRNFVTTPRVLLFDEIDAPLHPSMTRNLINIIQEVLIGKYGIKVIMTTHSPSTVALAPEDSIYTMRSGKSGLHPTKKGEALNILTAGIPTLAISYEGRRQVFVESSNDARIYEKIYSLIREKLNSERSLSFIEPGVKKKDKTSLISDSTDVGTGCAIVKKIVRQMDSYGNTSTYGLVDWDGRNTPDGRVMVLAQEEFYTLENGLLDPLLIGLLLVRACKSDTTDIGIGENESYLQIINSPKDRMQKIADQVALKIFTNAPKSKVTKKYLGDLEIEIDERASSKKGHCYETDVIKAFPCLLKIQNRREGKLMDEIIYNVLLDNPDLTPKAFADAFLKILNHNSHAD